MNEQTPRNLRNDLKGRSGLRRLWNACLYSYDGLVAAWRDEQSIRQIIWGCVFGLPLAFWLGQTLGRPRAAQSGAGYFPAGGAVEQRH